ncbi:hypothetical protein Cfor_12624 [Coptotermes formosanus]|uniref:Ionotropic receptor 75a N-terminal domain-containing protein n=1 Tax=Coptotermes formosanus TaxID=36987 RepID=A0A6L2PYC5_COPFO|nr:hypothetical protein Cfor_12624 [Coptotermes formosanus]
MWMLPAVLISLLNYSAFGMDVDVTIKLVYEFITEHKLKAAVAMTCWKRADQLQLARHLSEHNVPLHIFESCADTANYTALDAEYSHLAVIVDLTCSESLWVLREASNRTLFKGLHFWLLLHTSGQAPVSRRDPLVSDMETLNLPLDSHVTIARSGSSSDRVLIQDMYRLADQPLTVTPPRHWRPGRPLPPAPRRDDFNNIILKTGVTVIDDPWEHFLDLRYRHLNTMSKLSYVLTCYLAEMLNFRMEVVFTEAWGYPINGTKWYAGLAGLLQRGIVEIGATTLLIKTARLDVIDYAAEAFPFVGNFMFLKPSLSEVSIIYTLPFSRTVWIVFALIVATLTVALVFAMRTEQSLQPSKFHRPDTNDPDVKRLYFEKLYTQAIDQAFTSNEIGVANIRKGLHAFQSDADVYKVMSDTLEEHEKCRYKEIVVFVTNCLAYPVRKGSQYKEMIARKARWLKEIGFVGREYKRWYHQKPKCADNSHGFVSVRIQDFYPALVVLAYGILFSLAILVLEIVHNKTKLRCGGTGQAVASVRSHQNTAALQQKQQRWLN